MKDIALLIGNGVNKMSNGIEWKQLLKNIIEFCDCGELYEDRNQPFPLFYEQVFLHALNKGRISDELELKQFIAKQVSAINENEIHERIRNKSFKHIMTTNYEFLLEGCEPSRNDGIVKETKYSVFRNANINDTKFWHLHGDCNNPFSINLGYERYSGQLQQMRNYVTTVTAYKASSLRKQPLAARLKNGDMRKEPQSWIDLFFTHDIHIFGLTLDFVEIDLWWLLTYRARVKEYERKFPVENTIIYYVPRDCYDERNFKIKLMGSTGVIVRPIQIDHGVEYYRKVLSQIK